LIESLGKLGDYVGVVPFHKERLKIIEVVSGNKSIEYAKELCKIAYRLEHFAQYHEAISYFNEALYIVKNYYPDNEHEIAYIKCGIGFINNRLEDYDNALIYYKSAIKHIDMKFCKECDDDFISFVYNGIGFAYCYKNHGLSIDFLEKAIKIRKNISDKDKSLTWKLANSYDSLGATYRINKDFKKAINNHNSALFLRQNSYEADIAIARTYVNIAKVYIEMKDDLPLAINYLSEALKIRRQKIGSNNILVAEILELLAIAYEETQKHETALEFSFSAYKVYLIGNSRVDNAFEQLERIYGKANINALSFEDWLKVRMNNSLPY